MKIAAVADLHLGYPRFEEDAFIQAERALHDAESKSDAIIIAGDIFDVKIPRLETLRRAAEMLSGRKVPIFAIHGNHERRAKGMTNPVQLISKIAGITYLHGSTAKIGDLSITGIGSVPDDYAKEAISKVCSGMKRPEAGRSLLVIHQSLQEVMGDVEGYLPLDFLDALPFDFIIDGHIHKYQQALNGKLVVPGSTVVTQLRGDEQGERGYVIYDSGTNSHTFEKIDARRFFLSEVKLEGDSIDTAKKRVDAEIARLRKDDPEAIVKIRVCGKLMDGLGPADLSIPYSGLTFVQNALEGSVRMEEMVSRAREMHSGRFVAIESAPRRLANALKGKLRMLDAAELLECACEGGEKLSDYIDKVK
jgi:DNA repair exonuclease SbcCD nuclease subunit